MAKRLLKRKAVDVPKALPPRGKEEPEPSTTLCKGPETAAANTEPMLGKCVKCNNQANSEADHLCYDCHMSKAGFEYDEDQNRYVKKSKGRK